MSGKNKAKEKEVKSSAPELIGIPKVFLTYTFQDKGPKHEGPVLNRLNLDSATDIVEDYYVSSDPHPREALLQVFSAVDLEVYSSHYRLRTPYVRVALGEWTVVAAESAFEASIVVTIYENGWGSIVVVTNFRSPFALPDFIKVLKDCQVCTSHNIHLKKATAESGETCGFRGLLTKIVRPDTRLLFPDFRTQQGSESRFSCGHSYPFVVLHSPELGITDVKAYVATNAKKIYGISNVDRWGWRRTREEKAVAFIDADQSRRDDYAFYITPYAALEIDSNARMRNIKAWAIEDRKSSESVLLKLVLERLYAIETLRVQYHQLISIDQTISDELAVKPKRYYSVAAIHSRITMELRDYHNMRSHDIGHVSGVEWILFGRKTMGIDRMYASVIERIHSLEKHYEVLTKQSEYTFTAVLALISLLLAAPASKEIVNLLCQIPALERENIKEISWFISLELFITFVCGSMYVFFRASRFIRSKA